MNAVVGETNDGYLNDIRARALSSAQILQAIRSARGGAVEEGAVGAGTGTVAFGWKGGIGTSSRRVPAASGGWMVGVLVQANFGGVLTIDGRRTGEELGNFYLKNELTGKSADGSIMVVVATDAPLSDRNLARLARRAIAGVARTGSSFSNGSGDYVIAFSTAAAGVRTAARRTGAAQFTELSNDSVSPLFQAVAEATEEAIYNSLFMATTTRSHNVILGKDVVVERLSPRFSKPASCPAGERPVRLSSRRSRPRAAVPYCPAQGKGYIPPLSRRSTHAVPTQYQRRRSPGGRSGGDAAPVGSAR